jgi:hypothetical protein
MGDRGQSSCSGSAMARTVGDGSSCRIGSRLETTGVSGCSDLRGSVGLSHAVVSGADESRVGCGGESQSERRLDLKVALEEGTFVKALAPQPAGDFVVALAGVAGATRWSNISERVAAPARKGQYAVSLQRPVGRAAVRASAPSCLQRSPLVLAEVVLHSIHAPLAPAGGYRPSTSGDHHQSSVGACLLRMGGG